MCTGIKDRREVKGERVKLRVFTQSIFTNSDCAVTQFPFCFIQYGKTGVHFNHLKAEMDE